MDYEVKTKPKSRMMRHHNLGAKKTEQAWDDQLWRRGPKRHAVPDAFKGGRGGLC